MSEWLILVDGMPLSTSQFLTLSSVSWEGRKAAITSSEVQCFPKLGDAGSELHATVSLQVQVQCRVAGKILTRPLNNHIHSRDWSESDQHALEEVCAAPHDLFSSISDAVFLASRGLRAGVEWQ